MVSTDLAEHISNAFPGVPILFIGDPAQLPPILDDDEKERGVQPLLAATEPTATLTEVLRQAQDSRILRFATHLRSLPTKAPASTWQWAGKVDGEDLTIIPRPRSGCTKGLLKQFDEIVHEGEGVVFWLAATIRAGKSIANCGRCAGMNIARMLASSPNFLPKRWRAADSVPSAVSGRTGRGQGARPSYGRATGSQAALGLS